MKFLTPPDVSSSIPKTDTPGINDQDTAADFSIACRDQLFDILAGYLSIQDEFNPEVGFAPRTGIRKAGQKFTVRPRPEENISWIREFRPDVEIEYITDQQNTRVTRLLEIGGAIELQDSSILFFQRSANFERLVAPFEIRPGQSIAPGDYQFEQYVAFFSSDRSRMFSTELRGSKGSFFDGHKDSYRVGFQFQPSYQFGAEVLWNHDDITLPSGDFTTTLTTTRLRYSFTTTMFLNALIQYSSTWREISSNIPFNFIYKPLSDLFLVYNERRTTTGEVVERALIAKLTYLFNF